MVFLGKNDSKLRETYVMWNGLTEIEQWNTPTARMINGSDASFFPANLQKNDTIYAFTDELKMYRIQHIISHYMFNFSY